MHTGAPTIYVPWAAQSFCKRSMHRPEDLIIHKNFNADEIFGKKKKFLAFATRECIKGPHSKYYSLLFIFF